MKFKETIEYLKSKEVEINPYHIDELYKRIKNNPEFLKEYLGKNKSKVSARNLKIRGVKKFFNLDNLDNNEAKKQLTEVIANQLVDLDLFRTDLKLAGSKVLNIGSNMPIFDEYLRIAKGAKVISMDYDDDKTFPLFRKNMNDYVVDDIRQPQNLLENSYDLIISHASMPHMIALPRDNETDEEFMNENYDTSLIARELDMVFIESFRLLKTGGEIRMCTLKKDETTENVHSYLSAIYGSNFPLEESKILDLNKFQNRRVELIDQALSRFLDLNKNAELKLIENKNGGRVLIIKKVS